VNDTTEDLWEKLAHRLIHLIDLVIDRLETKSTTLSVTIQGEPMANAQINEGNTEVLTLTDTDDVTGAVVTPDPGSVSAVLSSTTDTLTVNADGTFTLTAGSVASVGNTVTFGATVGGVASKDAVGTYDVLVDVPPAPNPTTLSVTFGTETPEVESAAEDVAGDESEVPGTFRNS
jgi:hypothetical protein